MLCSSFSPILFQIMTVSVLLLHVCHGFDWTWFYVTHPTIPPILTTAFFCCFSIFVNIYLHHKLIIHVKSNKQPIWQHISFFIFLHSGLQPTGAKRSSASCPECICNRPSPWSRPFVSDWGCGAVILLSRGEFGREKNKICYQRGCVWTFCYMPNLWYNIVILQHIFILRNNLCERSYFVFNLGSFARNRECETQVCVFGEFFGNIC